MRTEERLKIIYETMAPVITRNEAAWKDYLKFGAQIYKHQFDNALLVYAQNPKATMLAAAPIWNKIGRYVNKGEKGIAVCEYKNAGLTMKYLFDLKQTNGNAITDIWKLDEEKIHAVSDRLSKSHNITTDNSANCKSALMHCINQIVDNTVNESIDSYLQGFEADIKEHFLDTLPQDGLVSEITEIVMNSCKYFIACKCGIETYEPSILTISHFDTIPLIARLGYSVTEISKSILIEIARNIKNIEIERRNRNERGTYEQQGASSAVGRFAAGEHNDGRRRTDWQIWADGNGLPLQEQSPKVFTFEDDRRADSENEISGRRSEGEGGRNHEEASEQRPDATDGRYPDKNPPSEQTEGHSRRDSNERIGADTEIARDKKEQHNGGSFLVPVNDINNVELPADTDGQLSFTETYAVKMHELIDDAIHRNYAAFTKLLPQIAYRTYRYIRLESDNYEPLSVEWLGDNQCSIKHANIQNGDLVYEPDMTIEINHGEQTIKALTYKQSGLNIYQDVNEDGSLNEELQQQLNSYLSDCLNDISSRGFIPVYATEVVNGEDIYTMFYKQGNAVTPYIPQKDENDEKGICITEDVLETHNGQIDLLLQAYAGDERVGYARYSIFEDIPCLNYIEVREHHRRKGIATLMVQFLARRFPDTEIVWGYTTENGTAFKEAVTYSIQNQEYTEIKKRLDEIYDEISEYESDMENDKYSDIVHDLWNDLHDEKQRLEVELYGLQPVKTYIKLNEIKGSESEIDEADGSSGIITSDEEADVSDKPSSEDISTVHKINYRYSEADNLYSGGVKSKFKANIEAIKLLKHLESSKRLATLDEQKILANYVGWGGLANVFSDITKRNGPQASLWENEYQELKLLLDEDEYKSAMNSTITAYYTEPKLIGFIYKALNSFGFIDGKNRKILDPAVGTGNFYSVLPNDLQSAALYGIELDSITGRIAKQLYQNTDIRIQGFETTRFDYNTFDVAVGNIPFNNIRLYDKRYEEHNFLIHDYFIAKSLDLVKPGGIIAYITTKGTMDKRDSSVREYIARRAELIGAVRLPNTAFKQIAGTEVTADILFLKKREAYLDEKAMDNYNLPGWVFTDIKRDSRMYLNQYFIDNPDMILGEMQFSRSMYGREDGTACIAPAGQDLYAELDRVLHDSKFSRLMGIFSAEPDKPAVKTTHADELISDEKNNWMKASEGIKNCTYVIQGDMIYYCENGWLIPQDIKGKKAERIKGLCGVKVALQAVVAVQSREYEYSELEAAQKKLNEAYDSFVSKYGYINSKPNITAFFDDDQLPLLRSIEDMNDDKETYSKAPIFTRATIKSYTQPTYAGSAKEALEISLNMKMKVDLAYMSSLYGQSEEEIISELGERIYLNPQKYYGSPYEGWEMAEEYLSGEVSAKLSYARLKAEENPIFERNVSALLTVQPPLLMPSDISFRIGSPWIPKDYFAQFMYETFDTPYYYKNTVELDYLEYTTQWRISGKTQDRSIKVNQTYGTGRVNAYEIYEDCLNLQSTTVRDPKPYIDDNGREHIRYVVNASETMIARSKQQQIKEAFANWLFRDKNRTEILLKIYNDTFNTIRPREYDGSHLIFPNMNEERELRMHQKNVAARIIYSGSCLMAHEVGAGKTAAMIAAGMYMKNIGAVKKPIFIVPNHLTEQWATEFMRFFPSADILVTTKKDFEKHNRRRFVSKIAVGDYDAIIIGHSQFEKIAMSKERQEQQLNEEIASLTYKIDQMKREKGENWAIKQIVLFQNNLKSRLERLIKEERKDDLLTFEQLGVDYMFVDEAQAYKNCFTYSKMRNVAGISQSSSQRAVDMLMKCQYLQELYNGRGVTFATGTPLSNSMAELFIMQRFLQPNILKKMGLQYFDSWAATFGEVVSSLEITPEGSGYRIKNRFSKFHNLPELMNIFKLVADIQTSDMLNLPVPKVKGGKAAVIVTECSEFQKHAMQGFVERAEAIRNRSVKPEIDNMLKLTNEAKLMAIDPRLINVNAPSDCDSKLNTCIRNAYDIWERTSENRLTQVIFCDSGTPKQTAAGKRQFNVYDETKQQLIQMGITESEIAFVHDAKTDAQRDEMFDKVRKGEIRILLGSTSKLGTGTNIQTKLIALHHLDVPWRPSDIIQRDGRGIRQFNTNPEIEIYRYVTKGTFDSYLWQIQEQKLRYITQIMTSKNIMRSCEDTDETVLTAAEVKAVATSNPLLAEKMEVDNEVERLKLLRGNWNNEKLTLERNISSYYPGLITKYEGRIEDIRQDLAMFEKSRNSDFMIVIDGITYDERPKAGEALLTVMRVKCEVGSGAVPIGGYRGFKVLGERKGFTDAEICITGKGSYSTSIGDSGSGCITRIENLVNKLPSLLQESVQALEKTKSQLDEAKVIVLQPFQFEKKLNEYTVWQSDINMRLEFKELYNQQDEILSEADEDEAECCAEYEDDGIAM